VNAAGAVRCANCNTPLGDPNVGQRIQKQPDSEKRPCPSCGYLVTFHEQKCPQCGYEFGKSRSTVIDFPKGQSGGFILKGVNSDIKELHFNEHQVVLNRDKIDKFDSSISTEKHVEITHRDGRWFLKDVSSNGATFIQVKGEVEITDGSLIKLGHFKIFQFKSIK
jgi:hypothetical protein